MWFSSGLKLHSKAHSLSIGSLNLGSRHNTVKVTSVSNIFVNSEDMTYCDEKLSLVVPRVPESMTIS